MHCIQGSDAHRLRSDPGNKKNLGVGDRATAVLLPEVSFEALQELFLSNDFARTRPHWPASDVPSAAAFDFIRQAVETGPTIIQDFHESMTVRGGRLYAVIADVCALANTNGGVLYIGVVSDPTKAPVGVANPESAVKQLRKEIGSKISPPIECQVDIQETQGKKIIRVLVPRGDDPPYAVDDNKVYVRQEGETALAVRDEIVQLVLRRRREGAVEEAEPAAASAPVAEAGPAQVEAPRTGVEVVRFEERDGVRYYTVRDLRNGNVVKNVTMASARRLWAYAISQFDRLPGDLSRAPIAWQGDLGTLGRRTLAKRERFDLAQKTSEGIRLYFGVTEDGIHGEWKRLVGAEGD
jgi:hypothetical protein